MTYFDIGVIAILGGNLALSAFRGLVRELFSFLALVSAWAVTVFLHEPFGAKLEEYISNGILADLSAYGLLFFATLFLVRLLGKLAKKFLHTSDAVSRLDRIFGGGMGLVKGFLIVMALLIPLQWFPSLYTAVTEDSRLAPPLEAVAALLGDDADLERKLMDPVSSYDVEDVGDAPTKYLEAFGEGVWDRWESGKKKVIHLIELGKEDLEESL